MVCNHTFGRLSQPLEQRKVPESICTEYLKDLEWFIFAQILNEMPHVLRDDANIASRVVERSCLARGSEDSHARTPSDKERPFIRIWVPVHFPKRTWRNGKVCSSH